MCVYIVLSVVGTIAMLVVAGGIYVHNIHQLHEWLNGIPSVILELGVGLILGLIAFVVRLIVLVTI